MGILIVVYSFTGNNRLLAQTLATRLSAEVEEVATLRRRSNLSILLDMVLKRKPRVMPLSRDTGRYDHVLLMAPLWDMHVAYPLASLLTGLKGRIGSYSFVSLCGYAREGQSECVRGEPTRLLGRAPESVTELHVGRLFPEEDRRKVRKVSRHRVTASDLDTFEPDIREVVNRLKR